MEKETFNKLVTEFTELNSKIEKLREFIINKEKFEKLIPIQRDLLIAQFKAMEAYLSILSIRLGLNAQPETNDNNDNTSDKDDIETIIPEVVNE